jgi:hypothetical protein
MKETIVQSTVTPTVSIVINGEDAAGNPTAKTWKMCLDYRALAKIEDATKRDLKKIENWRELSSGKDFPVIIHCCLGRYSPDVTLDDVLDNLNPQAQRYLSDALFELTFPGVIAAVEKQQAAGALPNEPTVTPTPTA